MGTPNALQALLAKARDLGLHVREPTYRGTRTHTGESPKNGQMALRVG
jgi:hypothetical protein